MMMKLRTVKMFGERFAVVAETSTLLYYMEHIVYHCRFENQVNTTCIVLSHF